MSEFSHIDAQGKARMVDVSHKPPMLRTARAEGFVQLHSTTLSKIQGDQIAKGSVLDVAQLAGIMAAKRTGELIPLCHPLSLSHVGVDCTVEAEGIRVTGIARTSAQTGVEMEALTAVSVACLTIYDMCKAVDKQMVIREIRLLEKTKAPLADAAT